jgi:CheY-like chemotaxis protein
MTKILVADDEPTLLGLISAALTDEGYTVVPARDGREAVELAVKESPDLVLLDVMMPRLSGREALRQIRAAPETQSVPVVLMSAGVPSGQMPDGVPFLPKPFDLDRLLSLIEGLL